MSKNAPSGLRYGKGLPPYGYCIEPGCDAGWEAGEILMAKRHVERTGHTVHWEQVHRRVITPGVTP